MPAATTIVQVYSDPAGGTPGPAVDISCQVEAVDIIHGRDDTNSQPNPPSCTLTLDLEGTPLPAVVDVGAVVTVDAHPTVGPVSRRFTGRVTDLVIEWQADGQDTPDHGIGTLIAVGMLADTARRVVGATPFPLELDGARVARVMAAAGVTLNPAYSDPGTVQIVARDIDAQPALEVARDAAVSAGGILWQTRAGEVRYADADHRRRVPIGLLVDSCQIQVSPTWTRTTDGLLNDLTISYGVAPEGGEQPTWTGKRQDSITKWGTYGASLSSTLADAAAATAMGNLLLTRNSYPTWVLDVLPLDVAELTDNQYSQLLALDMHDLVNVTGMPTAGGSPGSAVLWVEGWTEHLQHGMHDLPLVVSGYCRTSPAPRWDDLDPAWTWDSLPASLTWDSITCLGPMPSFGRWSDVPPALRWDQVPATVTWDTWNSWAIQPQLAEV